MRNISYLYLAQPIGKATLVVCRTGGMMQSITWAAIRGLFNPSYKALTDSDGKLVNVNANRDIWRQYHQGIITRAKTRSAILKHANGIEEPIWYDGANSTRPSKQQSSSYERDVRTDRNGSRSDTLAGIRRDYAGLRQERRAEGHSNLRSRLLPDSGDDGRLSPPYRRVSTKSAEAPGLRGVQGVLWRVSKDARKDYDLIEATPTDYYEVTDAKAFRKAIAASKNNAASAAVWLFGTGIIGLIGFSKRRKAA